MSILDDLKKLFKSRGSSAPAGGGSTGGASKRKLDVRKRFEIQREAISGTMSQFYVARDREQDKVVGLKVLDKKKTEAFESRFKGLKKPTEGEISFQFDHPNIVKTLEYGLTTEGEQYLVMELIEGPGINFLLSPEHRAMLEGTRLPLIRQIAEAVGEVHRKGFIHRDVCPRNVMVDSESGVLKLIDFGLTVPNTPDFTRPGNRTGNPNYMAPELVRRLKTDHRLDVFAFGVTAYELCTFDLPWQRGVTGKAAMDHASKPPQPLLKRRPETNRQLAEAIMSCVEPELTKRCESMEEFLKRIRGVESEDE